MKKIFLTGVSGMLGSNLALCWREHCEILGIYHQHRWTLDGIKTKQTDLSDFSSVSALLEDFHPDVIVHAAAAVDVDRCEQEPQWAYRTNVVATKNLVEAAAKNCKFVYISTDLVYDGVKGSYTESDSVNPVNVYAKSKLTGEQEASRLPNHLIARTNIFGFNVQDKMCFAERVIKEAKAKTIKGFTDSFFSSLYTCDMASLLSAAIEKDLRGIYHFGSSTSKSRYDFADTLAQQLGYGKDLITASSIKDYPFKARRAPDLSLQTKKLSDATGIKVPTQEETIEHFVKDYKNGINGELQ
jgi:dTDP-4-dehydrorhamnose reductase